MIHTIKLSDIHKNLEEPRHATSVANAISILVTEANDTIVLDFSDTGSLTPTFATCLCIIIREIKNVAEINFRLTGMNVSQAETMKRSLKIIIK